MATTILFGFLQYPEHHHGTPRHHVSSLREMDAILRLRNRERERERERSLLFAENLYVPSIEFIPVDTYIVGWYLD